MESKEQIEEQWLRSVIIPKIVKSEQLVSTNDEDLKVHTIAVKFIGTDEAFMLTSCYKAIAEYEYKGARETLSLVVKKTPDVPEEVFNGINFGALFSNEINGYTIIMPAILNFSKRKLNLPKYYYGDLQKASATLILEDFNSEGWKMTKERVNLSLEHILLGVKYLATFHGICYAIKQIDRKLFEKLIANLKESRYATEEINPDWKLTLKCSVQRLKTTAEKYHPEIPMEFIEQLESLVADYYHYGKQRVQPREPMATLCHGDYLRNNVCYKYEKESTENPIDVMMFDLQTMRYSSPMVDLSVFLALSAFKDVRFKHFDDIFNAYCKELASTYVEHTQLELPDFLSSEILLKEYIRFLPYSAAVSASFLMTLVEPDEMSSEEMLNRERGNEELIADVMKRGGEIVDRELAHQVKEMYDLSKKHNVDIGENISI